MFFRSIAFVPVLVISAYAQYCSHQNGDPCDGDLDCCTGPKSIATCSLEAFSAHGTWSVGACDAVGGPCVDHESASGADCL